MAETEAKLEVKAEEVKAEEIKAEAAALDSQPSDLEVQIIDQVEYYFGDANLRKDKFMKQTFDENDGWMSIETLLKFNRLKKLSDDQAVIAAALKKSTAALVEVAEDNSKLRRNPSNPLPEWSDEVKKDLNRRTVYLKGFPLTTKLEDVESFMSSKGYSKGVLSNIVLRRNLDSKEFKGSVFVEFKDAETSDKFVGGGSYRLADAEADLIVMSRNAYYKKKDDQRMELKGKLRDSAVAAAIASAADAAEEEELKYESGCVLCFDKCGAETTRESLKEIFGKVEDIQWVNFTRGNANGKIRFVNAGGAERALEAVKKESEGGVINIDGAEATCTILEGEAEEEYYKEVRREVASAKAKSKQSRFNHYRNTGRGRGRGKRRGGYRGSNDEPRAKRSRD